MDKLMCVVLLVIIEIPSIVIIITDLIPALRKRKKELKQMLDNIESLKLALIRSIATEDMNIADLKKKAKKGETE